MSMAFNTPVSTDFSRRVLKLTDGSPYRTRVTGQQPSDLGSGNTTAMFVYGRGAQNQDEIDNSSGGEGAARDFVHINRWWHSNPSTDYIQNFLDCFVKVDLAGNQGDNSILENGWYCRGTSGQNVSARAIVNNFGTPTNLNDRWLLMAGTCDHTTGQSRFLMIDPSDGVILTQGSTTTAPSTGVDPYGVVSTGPAPNFNVTFEYQVDNNSTNAALRAARWSDWDAMVAEFCGWDRVLTDGELQAFAQVGFAAINAPTGLAYDFNFMRDWRPTSTTEVYSEVNPADTMFFDSQHTVTYRPAAPVPVYLLSAKPNPEFNSYQIGLFSATTGTSRMGAWPSGTPQPSNDDIFNGVGAVESFTLQPDGINEVIGTFTTLDTGTSYEIFSIQDELDGGGTYGAVGTLTITTPVKASEIVQNSAGTLWASRSGWNWAWFDSADPQNMVAPTDKGALEDTDASGLIEITLSNTTLAKGQTGSLVLESNFDAADQISIHNVQVK